MKETFSKTRKPSKYKKLLPYVVLAVLLTISVLAWQYFENIAMQEKEHQYSHDVDSVLKEITERLHLIEMFLQSGAGLFIFPEEVTREGWRDYNQYRQDNAFFPGIQGVVFSRVVRPPELAQHIEEIRVEGYSDYTVWPEGDREVYAPVIFIEPFNEINRRAFGYDGFSEPVRRSAMERAMDTGTVTITGMVTLAIETDRDSQPGFLMYVPVYTKGMPLNTPEERREAINGFVLGGFRMQDLIHGIFPDPMQNIGFQIYDGVEISADTLFYDSHVSPDADNTESQPLFTSRKTMDLYGHQWTLTFETIPVFVSAVDRYAPKGIFAAGLLISFLIFFYLKTLETTDDRTLSLAQKMTSALRKSEEKYRFLTENISDVIWTVDLEGNLTYMSPAIEKITGFTPEEAMGMSMIEYIVQEDYDTLMARLAEELTKPPEERTHTKFMEVRYKTKDNRLVPVELSVSWLLDEQGNIIGVQGSSRDITERKQLEEQIAKSRKMYQSVVDTQQEMINRYMPDATLTFVNDAYCRNYGKNRQEMLGHKFLEFTPPELHDEILELINSLTPDKPSIMHEHYVLLPDGSIRWQEWTEQALFTEKGEIKEFQGVGRDITERVQAEDELLRAYDATIEGWAYALDLRDEETEGHSQRVTAMTLRIAGMMGMKDEELAHVRRGALLHDIGKMGIPDDILLKPGQLTDDEWEIMSKHPVYAFEMLSPIAYLRPALDIPYCHHEKFDGSGYPRGLTGEKIPLAARIFAVVDVFDALTSDRPYRKAWSREEALEQIRKESGAHFDPQVVEVFLKEIDNQI